MDNGQEQQSFGNVWRHLGFWWFTIQARVEQITILRHIICRIFNAENLVRNPSQGEFANPIPIDTWLQVQAVNDSKRITFHPSYFVFATLIEPLFSKHRGRIHGHHRSHVDDLERRSTIMGSFGWVFFHIICRINYIISSLSYGPYHKVHIIYSRYNQVHIISSISYGLCHIVDII